MVSNHFRIFSALSAILLAISACALPISGPAKPAQGVGTPTMASTQPPPAKPTKIMPTASVLPELPSATAMPSLTATEAISATVTLPVGVFPTDTPTATLQPVFADVMKVTNCYSGPGSGYDLVSTFQTGAKLEVVARDLGGGYIFVMDPQKPAEQCYILVNNVKLSGDTSILPQYTPLASPTAAPNFTATFKKFDTCKGDVSAQFIIVNTGSVPFRSAYIKVTNLKTNESAEKVVNAFDMYVACVIAKNIAPLDPGASGYLSSELFLHDPRGNKLRAVIQVCTEKALKGTCITTTINIMP